MTVHMHFEQGALHLCLYTYASCNHAKPAILNQVEGQLLAFHDQSGTVHLHSYNAIA